MGNPKKPMRKCVGCNELKEKSCLVRIIKTADGDILLDQTQKANGRGAYLCPNVECLQMAMRSKGLERALKSRISDELFDELREEFSQNAG